MAHKRILSFQYAFSGIIAALKKEPHLKFHFFAGLMVILAGLFFHLTKTEWFVVVLTIGLVISLELTNTAIEEVVDAFTQEHHPGAKFAKDVSSGAVLVAAITATVIAFMIYLPHLWKLFYS